MLSTVTRPIPHAPPTPPQSKQRGREALGSSRYLGHLLLPLGFGRLGVSIVVGLNDDQIAALRVDHKLAGRVL